MPRIQLSLTTRKAGHLLGGPPGPRSGTRRTKEFSPKTRTLQPALEPWTHPLPLSATVPQRIIKGWTNLHPSILTLSCPSEKSSLPIPSFPETGPGLGPYRAQPPPEAQMPQ